MTVVASLSGADGLVVQPGGEASCELSIANTASIVEQFSVLFVGDAAEWARSEPPVVSLFPGASETVTLTFAPPRTHTTPAGPLPFGVKVIPSNEPEASVTEEGSLLVGSFSDLGAELLPRVPTGRRVGRQRLAIDSRGNVPVPVTVSAIDAAEALKFKIRPSKVVTVPGAAHFVRIRVHPRQRMWRGVAQQKPYQVQVAPEGEPPLVLDGALKHKPLLPRWLFALIGLVAGLLLLWFLVIKPAVHNTAVNANKAALAAQAAQTQSLAGKVASANAAAAAAKQAAAAALAKTGATTTSTSTTTSTTTTTVPAPTTTTIPPPVTSPTDGQLEVVAAPGSTSSSSTPPVAAGTTLDITDIVVQNVSGSSGVALVQRLIPNKAAQSLLVENLGTLTDTEYRFPTPVVFTHEQQLQLQVDCATGQSACNVSIYYTGPITQPVSATTTTIP